MVEVDMIGQHWRGHAFRYYVGLSLAMGVLTGVVSMFEVEGSARDRSAYVAVMIVCWVVIGAPLLWVLRGDRANNRR
jgi:hypothetical protein